MSSKRHQSGLKTTQGPSGAGSTEERGGAQSVSRAKTRADELGVVHKGRPALYDRLPADDLGSMPGCGLNHRPLRFVRSLLRFSWAELRGRIGHASRFNVVRQRFGVWPSDLAPLQF